MSLTNHFESKVIIITGNNINHFEGASSGIGEHLALHFASLSAYLTLTGRNKARLEEVALKCTRSNAATKVLPLISDVTSSSDLQLIISQTISTYGKLDVLINNAGAFQIPSIFEADYLKIFNSLLDCNLRSVVELTHLAVPHLIASKGVIINISSVASVKPMVCNSIYAMTKAAIDSFTKCIALELGPKGVRVNAINPAAIRTPVFDGIPGLSTVATAACCEAVYPLRRIGEPEDCAQAVHFLASPNASFITGVCLLIDGGSAYVDLNATPPPS